MPSTKRSRRKIGYQYEEPIALFQVGDSYEVDVSKLSLEVKVQAMLEGLLGRLRGSARPAEFLEGVREGGWPSRPMAKPVRPPARVEAMMRLHEVPEDSARALLKNHKLTKEEKAMYYTVMAERARG